MKKHGKVILAVLLLTLLSLSAAFTTYAEEPWETGPGLGQSYGTVTENYPPSTDGRVYSGGPGVVDLEQNPSTEQPAGQNIDLTKPMVALTFDDGPSAANTPVILSYLEQYGARATFFVLGQKAAANADILQRMVADGCEIGNHTWNHESINKISADALVGVLNSTNDAVQAACGVRPIIMRPPGGGYNDASLATVGSLGMSAYYWSIDTRDWEHRNAAKTVEKVLNNVKDGDIILMHDIHGCTAESAATIIPELINRGYQLVTVTELANARGGAQPGQIYFNFRP